MFQVTDIDWTDWCFCTSSCLLKFNIFWFIIDLIVLYSCLLILIELLISLVLYVAASEMMDSHQLKEAYSQTIANMKAMQQTLKEITITIAHLQQGSEAKPIVTTSNRNSKTPGDTKLGNPDCPKKGKGPWKGKGKGRGFNNSFLCWWCKGKVSHDKAQHRMQYCYFYKEYKKKYWKEQTINKDETAPKSFQFDTLHWNFQ